MGFISLMTEYIFISFGILQRSPVSIYLFLFSKSFICVHGNSWLCIFVISGAILYNLFLITC